MAKTKVVLEFFLPTTKTQVVANCMADVLSMAKTTYDARDVFASYSGPFVDEYVPENRRGNNEASGNSRNGSGGGGAGGGRADGGGRVERSARDEADERARSDFEDDERARSDFEDDEGNAGPAEPAPEPAEPKRKRGRPPGSGKRAEASGSAAGSEQREQRAEGTGRSAEGNRGNVSRGTDEGAREGRGQGEGGSRGAGADRGNQRRDAEQARVADPNDWNDDDGPDANLEEGPDWWAKTPGDEWPDHLTPENIDETVLAQLLAKHFEACGDRQKTYAVMQEATNERTLKNVHPDDFDKLARALLKDAARIQFGVKR